MGLTKNSLIKTNADKVGFLNDDIAFQFTLSDLRNVDGVNTSYTLDTKDIPYDLITYGRVAYSKSEFDRYTFWNSESYGRFSIGVHPDYATYDKDKTSNPAIITGGVGGTLFESAGPTKHNRWGFVESFGIYSNPDAVPNLGYTVICVTTAVDELQRELIYDESDDTIHYIALVQYQFKLVGQWRGWYNNGQNYTSKNIDLSSDAKIEPIKLLIDFKFKDTAFQNLEILNSNILINSFSTSLDFSSFGDPNTKWYIKAGYGNCPTYANGSTSYSNISPITIDNGGKKITDIFPSPYSSYYPSQDATNILSSFSVTKSLNNIDIVVSNNKFSHFYYNYNHTRSPWLANWKYSTGETTRWAICGIYDSHLPRIWALNPSGAMDFSTGSNFPIFTGWQESDTSTAILAKDDTTCKYTIQYVPGEGGMDITAVDFPGSISAYYMYYDTNIKPQKRELMTAGIKYTQNASIYYIAYILTSSDLFMYVIYSDDVSKIYKYPRNKITGLYSAGPVSDKLIINKDYNSTSYISTSLITPNFVGINVGNELGTATYEIELSFISPIYAQAAAQAIISNTNSWEILVGNPISGEKISIDNQNTRSHNNSLYIRVNLLDYLRSHPELLKSNLTFYLRGIDTLVPYILSGSGEVDARPLQLQDIQLQLDYNGSTRTLMVPSGNYSSGVLALKDTDLLTGNYTIICSGLVDNILYTRIKGYYTDMNWTRGNNEHSVQGVTNNISSLNTSRNLSELIPNKRQVKQYSLSQNEDTSSTVVGTNGSNGLALTIESKCHETKTLWFPYISVYDDHQFIIGRISLSNNIIDIDKTTDSNYNKSALAGKFFIPQISDSSIYRLAFNFRCAPNYIDSTGKYTLYYEGKSTTSVKDRLSTPMIKKWWIVGIPKKDTTVDYILPNIGLLENIPRSFNTTSSSNIYTNFTGDRIHTKSGSEILYTADDYEKVSYAYLNSNSTADLISHVQSASAGSNPNIGTVWVSGYNTIPSGYMDFNNVVFTTTYSGSSLSSGVIPNGLYAIFFISEDTIGNRTCVDLNYLTQYDVPTPYISQYNY